MVLRRRGRGAGRPVGGAILSGHTQTFSESRQIVANGVANGESRTGKVCVSLIDICETQTALSSIRETRRAKHPWAKWIEEGEETTKPTKAGF